MAISPKDVYPGKIDVSDPTGYPYGAGQNVVVPGDGTGTPWEAALVNDIFGLFQKILTESAIIPSGTPDDASTSQYWDGLREALFSDSAAPTRIGASVYVVQSFASALAASGKKAEAILTRGHTSPGVGASVYLKTGTTGTASTGNEGVFFDSDGVGWKLQHDGEVFYTQFGVGTGASDDLPKIKDCHDFANSELARVVAGGKLTINANSLTNIEVLTPTDFGGSKFVVKDGSDGQEIYSINPSADRAPFTVDPSVVTALQPELLEGAFFFPALQADTDLENCLILVENTQRLSRRGAGAADVLREDSFIHFRDGNCLGALLLSHTSGALTVTARPLERDVLEFGNVNIVQDFTSNTKRFTFAKTTRNQTQYKKIFLENGGVIDDLADSSSVLQAKTTAYLLVEDIDGENMNAGASGNSGYALSLQHCVAMTFNRVSPNSGWGVTNTNWVKNWVVTNSYLNRIDNHYGLGDLTIRDCRLIIQNVEIGYGRGKVTLENVTCAQGVNPIRVPDDEPIALAVVNLRAGWQLGYSGEINMKNITIEITGDYPTVAERNWVGGFSWGRQNIPGCDPTVNFYLPNVTIEGMHLRVVGGLTGELEYFGALMWDVYFDPSDSNDVLAPSRIRVERMTSNNESDDLLIKPFKGITTVMSDPRWLTKTCRVDILDCHNGTDSFNTDISSLSAYDTWRFTRSLFDWSLPGANQDASNVKFNVNLYRCTGAVYLNSINGKVKAHHSEVVEVRAFGSATSTEVSKISHSKLWPLFRDSGGGNWDWYLATNAQSLLAESCEIVPADYTGGTVVTVALSDRQRLVDCYTLATAPIDQTGVDRLWRSFENAADMYKKAT